MRKILLLVVLLTNILVVNAEKLPVNLNAVSENSKISYNSETLEWTNKITKLTTDFYTRTKLNDNLYYYVPSDGLSGFSTDCDFEFISEGKLIGYSNKDLKFYNLFWSDGLLNKEELSIEEIESLIPDFRIIKISELNNNTNSVKIKKHLKNLNLFIYNDTDKTFENYYFTSGNSRIKNYAMSGFVTAYQKGMIQFAGDFVNTKETPWYIILVR